MTMESPASSSHASSRKSVWSFEHIKWKPYSLLGLNEDREEAMKRRLLYMSAYGNVKRQYLPQKEYTSPQVPVVRFFSVPDGNSNLQPVPKYKPSPLGSFSSKDFPYEDHFVNMFTGINELDQDVSAEQTSNNSTRTQNPGSSTRIPESVVQSLLRPQSIRIGGSEPLRVKSKWSSMFTRCLRRNTVEYRPIFTYWITIVHVVLFLTSVLLYGFSPIGRHLKTHFKTQVTLPNQTQTEVCWSQPENVWLGPRLADLIKFGARYPLCMRHDLKVHEQVVSGQKERERSSGCCLFDQQSKCYQTQKHFCSGPGQEWLRYDNKTTQTVASIRTNENSAAGLLAVQSDSPGTINMLGPVCGLDPEFCLSPRSSSVMPWSTTDVTEWPICEHTKTISHLDPVSLHMTCEITARPCCLGIRGECILTTKEHCDFVRGHYNEKAVLCSQVNCLEKTCGMLPFMNGHYPDQFYRILTSLLIHDGTVQLCLTVVIQLTFVRNLEKLIGWGRMTFVYILSGCVGNLLAACFEPYQRRELQYPSTWFMTVKTKTPMVGTGPMASFVALAALRLIIYLFYSPPVTGLMGGMCKNICILLGFFLCGFMPWLDNFAHLGGLISGVFSSFVLLPYPRLCPSIISEWHSTVKPKRISPISATLSGPYNICNESRSNNESDNSSRLCSSRRRVPVELICFALWLSFTCALVFLFYHGGVVGCTWCSYFTCLPLASNMCDSFQTHVQPPDKCTLQLW